MLLKWIVCKVPEHLRSEFIAAQKAWSQLAALPGFKAQTAGWNIKSSADACILSMWNDLESYQQFMNSEHDKILRYNQQDRTRDAIATDVMNTLMELPGAAPSLEAAITDAEVIRVADCIVREGREAQFREAERDVWAPGMQQADGMLGGVFCRSTEPLPRYLVVSFWKSVEQHESYVQSKYNSLSVKSEVADNVEELSSYLIKVDRNWTVLPAIANTL